MKHEWLLLVPQHSRANMKQGVATYIRYYNVDRNHSANGELPPVRYKQMTDKKCPDLLTRTGGGYCCKVRDEVTFCLILRT